MTRLAALLVVLAAPAIGQQIDCTAAMTQIELNYCAEQEWSKADTALNQAYQTAMADLKQTLADRPEDLAKETGMLRDAQRAWIAFRDANCAVAGYPMRGGSAEPLLVYACLRDMTLARTEDLNRQPEF
ncbi:MAG: lysozyme inhibitor LprI family protein [Tabrizicola sp.]|uniref:lysozyme inhibitor LprI family protein n=1 Tax=Tabrizicola sp. TaxID=2005166 RepID=UPI002734362C|nr:lysozyme inhibitor LprI family protein [Tabrizicola sp.]MDP3264494.1 lysozyme inhibitor LprI family protein [Tabrizicola sp.]MDP3649526.1 lysozyme inhibitor LprI family protein [Paracoccaceae bacterium]MDZ4065249.1 lysozyme inhibitor LprI family protein [Tabrizicola sp.]